MSLLSLFGCGKRDPSSAPSKSGSIKCGGKVENSYDAPKTIESERITSFTARFYRENVSEDGRGGDFYTFEVNEKDGKTVLAETEVFQIECEADENLFAELYNELRRFSLFEKNGKDVYTAGLPPEYQPCSLTAVFDSGEKLYFRENGDPNEGWCCETARLFAKLFTEGGHPELAERIIRKPAEVAGKRLMQLAFNETGMVYMPWMIITDCVDSYYCYYSDDEDGTKQREGFTASIEDVEKLMKTLDEAGIGAWDGYSLSRSLTAGLMDADRGFTFNADFRGSMIRAHGYNCFPEGYAAVEAALREFFEKGLEK